MNSNFGGKTDNLMLQYDILCMCIYSVVPSVIQYSMYDSSYFFVDFTVDIHLPEP